MPTTGQPQASSRAPDHTTKHACRDKHSPGKQGWTSTLATGTQYKPPGRLRTHLYRQPVSSTAAVHLVQKPTRLLQQLHVGCSYKLTSHTSLDCWLCRWRHSQYRQLHSSTLVQQNPSAHGTPTTQVSRPVAYIHGMALAAHALTNTSFQAWQPA
jgi:hypothetical protein